MIDIETYRNDLVFTVSQINRAVRDCLEVSFKVLRVTGEVSNCTYHSSGHVYFSLKDEGALIRCVLFRGDAAAVRFKLEEGLQIIVRAKISAYMRRGEYQLIVSVAEPAGYGSLQLAYEQLKSRLGRDGLFELSNKKPIPALPLKVGIITSPTGAAVRDILTVMRRRFAGLHVMLYPVRVQGDGASGEITEAIRYFNAECPQIDVLLVGRGGGSLEDLWAFNEENVVRAIAGSRIPVISCIGHETDNTLSDLAADLRASTPSAAAEMVIGKKNEMIRSIHFLVRRLVLNMEMLIRVWNERIIHIMRSRALSRPADVIIDKMQHLDELRQELTDVMARRIDTAGRACERIKEKLAILSPMACLSRGYAVAWHMPAMELLKDVRMIKDGIRIRLRLGRGEAEFTAKNVKKRF